MRKTGVLLHISSLPTEYGIGDFGPSAYKFADYLKSEGHKYWQILPINHCGYGNSPYNPISGFALSPYLISPDLLYQRGLINQQILLETQLPPGDTVHYESVYKTKDRMLAFAARNWMLNNNVEDYIENHALHLKPYLAFSSLSRIYDDSAWYNWQDEHRTYSNELYANLWKTDADYIKIRAACQAMLWEQLHAFKEVLREKGISLVGDMPLYLSYESADVWAFPQFFDLNAKGQRLSMAGVPPDAFAAGGQLWGNPIYNWHTMRDNGFGLFMQRIGQAFSYLDMLRLDHFIGYVNYWKVDCPVGSDGEPQKPRDAMNGNWVRALPEEFFGLLCHRFGKESFIAEDLGILNSDVCHIRDSFGFPGMIILQFCFEESVPDVSNFPSERWLYTGTHDNSTLLGWYDSLNPDSSSMANLISFCKTHNFRDCKGAPNRENIHKVMKSIALSSACERVIIPYQDILGLDDSARMNIPGTALGNWQWRINPESI
jgi:4-alpha-glucanotransferase